MHHGHRIDSRVLTGAKYLKDHGFACMERIGIADHFDDDFVVNRNGKPADIADLDQGFVSLYNGVNLDGWVADESWKAGEVLTCTGDKPLTTTADYDSIDLLFDVLLPKGTTEATLTVRGRDIPVTAKPGVWKRLHLVTDAGKGTPITLPALKGMQIRNVFLKKAK